MPFRPRPPLVTDKHEVVWTNLGINASTVQSVVLSRGKKLGDVNASTEVPVGSRITWLYLEFNVAADDVTNAKILHWEVACVSPNNTQTSPALYYQDDRSFIIKRGMEMLPKDVGTVFKRIVPIRIPKVYQRQKEEMDIEFNYVCTSAELINICGFVVYKPQT